MFDSIKNFVADCHAGYRSVRDDVYFGTTTVYDSKVRQCVRNTAVAILKAWKWVYEKMAKVHSKIESFASNHPVVSALVMPAVVVGVAFVAAAICGLIGCIPLIVAGALAECFATLYVSYIIGKRFIPVINSNFTNEYVCMALGFVAGFVTTACVLVYKAILIALVLSFI